MAKSKLEQVLEHLINKEEEKAKDLLHTVIVEKARSIHESLMEQDQAAAKPLNESDDFGDDELTFEEFFGEGDLDDEETDGEADEAGAEGDAAAEFGGEGDAEGDETADFGGEAEADAEGDLESDLGTDDAEGEADEADLGDDADIEDLKKAIAELQAEFEKLQGGDAEVASDDADAGEAADFGGEGDAEGDAEVASDDAEGDEAESSDAEGDEADDEDFFEALDSLLGEDFADLTEGAVDDLETVKPVMKHDLVGAKSGDAQSLTSNETSPIPQKARDKRQGGTPVKIVSDQHHGYDRETAPSKKEGTGAKAPKNVQAKAAAKQTKVKKSGDDAALLNKGEGFGEENKKSPLSSMGTKNIQK